MPGHGQDAVNASAVRTAFVGLLIATATSCTSSTSSSTQPAPRAIKLANVVAAPAHFHTPTGPGDAAAEYVAGTVAHRDDLSTPLACRIQNSGPLAWSLPLVFETTSAHSARPRFVTGRVVRLSAGRWRVTVGPAFRDGPRVSSGTAIVVRRHGGYEICGMH